MLLMKRSNDRAFDQLRDVNVETGIISNAEGSALIKFGNTHVICTASIENSVPRWMKNSNEGWITAEYGMLPRSTHTRTDREAARGKQSGRTLEIQRLIGRSLRAVTDTKSLGERQVRIDCDVIQADGGTRTAAITGGYIALYLALKNLVSKQVLPRVPLSDQVAAISCGIYKGYPVLDLDYSEDSSAEADCNFVLTGTGGIIEIQATAEKEPFSPSIFDELTNLAKCGVAELVRLQKTVLDIG